MKEAIIGIYNYGLLLNPEKKDDNGNFVVMFKGKPHIMPSNQIELATMERLTQQDIFDLFEGTDHIIGIRGDFE